jgi:hypothetical protein
MRALKRLAHELRLLMRGDTTEAHQNLRERLVAAGVLSAAIDLIGSTLVYYFENDADGSKIKSFGDSVFWSTAQLLTVSSQLPNPLTTGGRIVDLILELYAISVVAAVAGTFADFLHHRREESRKPAAPGQK